jgi:hypothetical protein
MALFFFPQIPQMVPQIFAAPRHSYAKICRFICGSLRET